MLYFGQRRRHGSAARDGVERIGALGNGQCTVAGAGSFANGSGDTLTLTLNLSFAPAFTGNRVMYLAARSNGDLLNSAWQAVGSRTVP